jgi:benzoyl-CoA reductase/2-hydroxyglutaryl-CoA dehydratase subunit BcrC/BadD/HgdB
MKTVLYTSPYVPAEWIEAHGLEPCKVVPSGRDCVATALNGQGVCPFVRTFCSHVLPAQGACGIVMTTTCDQMRHAFDVVARRAKVPALLLNIPRTWQTVAARRMYMGELDRLSGFLVHLGGTRPTDDHLAQAMRAHDEARCRGGPWAEAHPTAYPAIPVALVGGPMREEDLALFDLIRDHGGSVALDATEGGEAGRPRPFDRRRLGDEPFLELADAYLDGIADVSRRPNHGFYEWLGRLLKERDICGVVLHRYPWCDLWHAELERIRQYTGLPVLDLDAGGDDTPDYSRHRTRVCAFMEMLR